MERGSNTGRVRERQRINNLTYRRRHRDKIIEYKRRYYARHREKLREYNRLYARKSRDASKEFRLGTTACIKCDSLLVDIEIDKQQVVWYHCTKCGSYFRKEESDPERNNQA